MAGEIKPRVQVHGKTTIQDLAKSITNALWSYDSVKRVVKNNYVILNAIVRNAIKSLNINADNFDFEAFNDNFDIHDIDTQSQDTLADSLAKVLSRFIIAKVDNNVDITMEKAPYEIESRLKEIIDYLRKNPGDNETVDYAKELIANLRELDRALAAKYSRELSTILNPKPAEPAINVENILKPVEPKPVVRVIKPETVVDGNNVLKPVTESRLRQIRSYESLRPKLRELRETTANVIEKSRKREIRDIEDTLRQIFELLKDPRESKSWSEYVEAAERLIERLRELDAKRSVEYEEKLKAMINLDGIEFVLRSYLAYIRVGVSASEYYINQVRALIAKLRLFDKEKAGEYERKLNTVLYEKRKYANYGRKVSERRVRIHYASYRITDFNEAENADSDNKPWKRHVRGILKWAI